MNDLPPGRYRHHKGRDYTVLGTARHSETEEVLVVYRQEYGSGDWWVRPLAMFQESVPVDGRKVPRFRLIEEEDVSENATQGSPRRVPMADSNDPSLYERLGGVYAIATVVDDFIDRIMANPILNANPKVDEAHHRVPPPGFKYLVTEMVCWATGGPQKYTGKTMKDSHAELNITEGEWQAFLKDLETTLDSFDVPEKEKGELFAIVASTKADIVVPPQG